MAIAKAKRPFPFHVAIEIAMPMARKEKEKKEETKCAESRAEAAEIKNAATPRFDADTFDCIRLQRAYHCE